MRLTSPVFANGETIPFKYGQDGQDISPPLAISGVPEKTVSFVLIMDDPDVPAAAGVPVWDHWVVFNIPASMTKILENTQPNGIAGKGTGGKLVYSGPRPPDKEHRYFFKLFALDTMLDLPKGSTKDEVLAAARNHILDKAELMGRFAPSTR